MTSLDDELALFESEISSLVSEPAPSASSTQTNGSSAAPIPNVAKPAPKPKVPKASVTKASSLVPPQVARPLVVPNVASLPLAPPRVSMPFPQVVNLSGMRPPMPGMFVPHQMMFRPHQINRAPPPPAPNVTIEGAPTTYKAEPGTSEEIKVTALASDVEAMERKKNPQKEQSERNKQTKKKKYIRTAGGQIWDDQSLSEWDPNDFRIFCGDLGNEVSDELLAKAFRKYPSFDKAKVIRDSRSNKSKGYGFVSFKSQEDYVRAIREMDGKYVGNRPIKLRKSQWKDRQLEVVKKKQKQKAKLGLMF